MDKAILDFEMRSTEAFFRHTASIFGEDDSEYSPNAGEMTVAQQIAHVAQTNEWYVQGATRPEGFDMNFEAHMAETNKVTSISAALEWLGRSFVTLRKYLAEASDAELASPLPEGIVLPGVPKQIIFLGVIDHCAHHRGSLSVYARSLGKTPPMPYEAQVEWQP